MSTTSFFQPSDTLRQGRGDRYEFDSIWFLAYEHFARRLLAWRKDAAPCEFLNNTSSINNHGFDPLYKTTSPYLHLSDLFRHVGLMNCGRADFLRFCGLKQWRDLDKPIAIQARRPQRVPGLDVSGRILKQPGPNKSHPKALTVYNGRFRFDRLGRRRLGWSYEINYS